MNFLQKLTSKFQQFMVGRYGDDRFTSFLSLAGCVLFIFGYLIKFVQREGVLNSIGYLLYFVGWLMIMYGLFRSLSKNHERRRRELMWYLAWSEKPRAEIKLLGNKIRDRKTHRYFRCKNCKTIMRVPKGRGKIEITCPKCRIKVVKKT